MFYILAIEVELWFHHFFEHGIGIYMQWCRASQQPECGYETYKPETVVAMQMGYEYVVYEREMNVVAAELQLCAFAAVNHELLVAYSYHLRTCIVACGRQCRPTPQYMYLKCLHCSFVLCR